MTKPRILLVQARAEADPMRTHECDCIARRLGPLVVDLTIRNAIAESPSVAWLDRHDGFIIGGSGVYSVHHPRSAGWVAGLRRMVDAALERSLPSFGICFGHQLLGYHFGSAVNTDDISAELGTVDVELTDAGASDELFSTLERSFPAHTGHSDHVDEVPEGLLLLARNEQLETQAFRVRGAPFFSTQFHPDLTGAEAIIRATAYQEGLAASAPHTVAEGARRFLPQADAAVALLARFAEIVAQDP